MCVVIKYAESKFTENGFPPVDPSVQHRIILATEEFFIVDGCGKILILFFK